MVLLLVSSRWLIFFSGAVVFLSSFCVSVVDSCVSASLLGLSVRFCTCPLRMESVSYSLRVSPLVFKASCSGGTRLPSVGPLGLGSLMCGLDLSLPGEDL